MQRLASDAPADRLPRRLAAAAVVLMLIVVLASAWLRLAQPRPGCVDWPGCRAPMRAGAVEAGRPAGLLPIARAVHRGAASALLAVAIVLTVVAWRRRAHDAAASAHALVLVLLAVALAALGVVTPGSRAVPVLLGNQLGGLVLLALAWRLWRRLHPRAAGEHGATRQRGTGAARGWAALAALVWLVQAGTGALSGGAQQAGAPFVHLGLALAAAPLAAVAAWLACHHGRRTEGLALLALVALQVLLGLLSAGGDAAPPLVLLHAGAAAAGIALLAGLTAPWPARV